jgi:hypothetical protein
LHIKSRVFEILKSAASADGTVAKSTALKAVEMAFEQNKDIEDPTFTLKIFADYEPLSFTDIYSENNNNASESERLQSETEQNSVAEENSASIQNDFQQNLVPLRSLIPYEREFDFIKVLFNDSRAEYNEAIDALEKINNYPEAIMFVKNNYFRKNAWDLEKDEVKLFYEIIAGRY